MHGDVAIAVPVTAPIRRYVGLPGPILARFNPGQQATHHRTIAEGHTAAITELIATQDVDAGSIRPFERADIPGVVALRQQLFRKSERESAADLERYIDELFFGGPFADDRLPSLVLTDEYGAVAGFLGIVSRRMLFGARTLRVAVATQFMVSPTCRGLAGRRIARALIQGPQDLTISDAANESARRLWATVGGRTSLAYSLQWTCALRPARFAATRAANHLASRALAYAARPLFSFVDNAFAPISRWIAEQLHDTTEEPLIAKEHHPELGEILEQWTLRPRYDAVSFGWVIDQASMKRGNGVLQRVLVRESNGNVLGWFLYCLNRGGVSQVVQVAAAKGGTERVLARMIDHARRRGAVALSGRFDPSTVQELSDAGCSFRREGPWMLYHSRHPGVECAIESGNAFLSRLDGEWWMSF